ncbi:hypothetical protein Plec18170_000552 [Paecilomyces lecythidis]
MPPSVLEPPPAAESAAATAADRGRPKPASSLSSSRGLVSLPSHYGAAASRCSEGEPASAGPASGGKNGGAAEFSAEYGNGRGSSAIQGTTESDSISLTEDEQGTLREVGGRF